jgi:hypothetical protein
MATVLRRRFGTVWVVALLLVGLLGAGGDRQVTVPGAADRALAAVAALSASSARGDIALPRADGHTLVPSQQFHGHPDSPAALLAVALLAIAVLFRWRRHVVAPGRPDRHVAGSGARGPPASLVTTR